MTRPPPKEPAVPAEKLRITLAGSEHVVEDGTTAGLALADRAALTDHDPGTDRSPGAVVIAARVNGELRDLTCPLADGDQVAPVTIGSDDGLNILRHSAAHVMAQAVQDLFPQAKLGIGPPIENGFYYDFDVPAAFTPDDLKAIEQKMRQIVKQGQRFSRRVVTDDEARGELASEPYKLELIGLKGGGSPGGAAASDTELGDSGESVEVGGSELTIYDNLNPASGELCWKDLCRGPHLPTTRNIPAFKLLRSGGAYWRGSEKNPQLQRIYGTAWPSREAQDEYLALMAEAEKRDHRKLGAELDLFSFPTEIGSGLPVFHPKGGIIRKALEDYSRKRHEESGYDFVYTPHITKSNLFETSGHLQWYAEGMYPPMELEGAKYYPKPMNCPMHILIYASRGRSYRELPLRLFEFGTVYRYEKSGVVHGLTRARGFTQDDSHIFCTPEQLQDELASLLDFVVGLLRDYGLTEFEAELSTRPEKFVGEIAEWDKAEAALTYALDKSGLPYVVAAGEGAFYAPKIDVHVKDAIGRRWQLSTLQVDFQEPGRFGIEYQAADGSRQRPYMIHRALFGSIERFFGILTEHYAGAFPPWLAPVQVVGIPISDAHAGYLQNVATRLREHGIRVEVDTSDDRMQKKIRTAQRQKVPYMLLAGDEDVAANAVSFRYRSGEQKNGVPIADAIAEITGAVASRVQV
ncbi:MAG TPA: threonine--tRNA ligase [Streptosporangiaceae bacterium]|nr:threonine--tRNA ligase [Streptosporangiaceae bacterium]